MGSDISATASATVVLPIPPGPCDRDETPTLQQLAHRVDHVGTTDGQGQARGQIVVRARDRWRRRVGFLRKSPDRGDKNNSLARECW